MPVPLFCLLRANNGLIHRSIQFNNTVYIIEFKVDQSGKAWTGITNW